MNTKENFWNDISIKLENHYILQSHPSTWNKSEINFFLDHLKKNVTEFRKEQNIEPFDDVKISYDTFRRILVKKETQGSDYTRNMFAQYFGERSYLDYIQTIEVSSKEDEQTKSTKLQKSIIGILGLMLICAVGLYSNSFFGEKSECLEIKEVILGAIASEFNAYKSVPETDKSIESLKEYFFEDNTAYKKILRVINNEKIRKWVLSNDSNISSANMLDFDCNYIDNDLASITTKEHWNIQWYDTQINEYAYVYDTMNIQTYYLRKINSKWKITINDYDKTKGKVHSKIFSEDDFDKKINRDQVKRRIVEFMASGDTQSALWWLSKYAEISAPQILNDVVLLNGKLQSHIRMVNTNDIEISKYHFLINEINLEIFNILKRI